MIRNAKNLMEWYQDLGIDCFMFEKPQNRAIKEDVAGEAEEFKEHPASKPTPLQASKSSGMADGGVGSISSLSDLKKAVESFNELEIKKAANKTVFGDGNPDADVMLIGEAPGANEDAQGIPFCGQSGKLLTNIIASMNMDRTKYYITNTVFWRPPANRRPTSQEIEKCRPYVEKHIELVKPKVIVLVGSTAVESLLNTKIPMNSLRKQSFDYTNKYLSKKIKTFVIFHPSYLLRQPSQKKLMYFDILQIYSYLRNG